MHSEKLTKERAEYLAKQGHICYSVVKKDGSDIIYGMAKDIKTAEKRFEGCKVKQISLNVFLFNYPF